MNIANQIKSLVEKELIRGGRKFIIFPYGDIGIQTNYILNTAYGIKPFLILDNKLCKYNNEIKPVSYLDKLSEKDDVCVILASKNKGIYGLLKEQLLKYIGKEEIVEFESMKRFQGKTWKPTVIGKYSCGPLCKDDPRVESVGAFCSFAYGCVVVANHPIKGLSTHPIMHASHELCPTTKWQYEEYTGSRWYLPGIHPKTKVNNRRARIGNDVWLGRNVVVTNGAYIGNGVIAGAGAVITKDIPDYAIVVGVPAHIIRYRYSPEQIEALNRIAWWDWSDDFIREHYDDLYLPIEQFIEKYDEDRHG